MKLVVDTNVVFSALIAGNKTRELILDERTDLYAPEFFFTELENHREEIARKSTLSEHDIGLLLDILFADTKVVPRQAFESEREDARQALGETDPDDVPFLGLALHLDADIWSDDTDFDEQDEVTAWRTHELVEHLD